MEGTSEVESLEKIWSLSLFLICAFLNDVEVYQIEYDCKGGKE